jgi:hypothetical protein
VPTRSVRASVVGSQRVVKAGHDGRRDPAEVLSTVLTVLPGAEEKIFNLAIELLSSQEGARSLAGLPIGRFTKHPWYGAMLAGLLALHRGDRTGADALTAAAARWPDGFRQMAEKLAEKEVRYALDLVQQAGLAAGTFQPVPSVV